MRVWFDRSISGRAYSVCPFPLGLQWMWQADALTHWVMISLIFPSPGARTVGLSLQTLAAYFSALHCTRVREQHGGVDWPSGYGQRHVASSVVRIAT